MTELLTELRDKWGDAGELLASILFNADVQVYPCGSRVTCEPPVMDTDSDYLLFIPTQDGKINNAIYNVLDRYGFKIGGSGTGGDDRFISMRCGVFNFITTSDEWFRDQHVRATAICKRLNLLDKKDRIAVFEILGV